MTEANIQKLMGMDVEVPQIKLRRIEDLTPYYRNSRTHSPAQIETLQRLMLEFGWTNTVLIDDMGIVAGHGRCMAAEEIYKRGEQINFPSGQPIPIGYVPTLDVSGWSAEQRKAYIIADNQSALQAGWDEEMLKAEIRDLDAADYDLSLTAFEEDDLDALLAETIDDGIGGGGDPDDVPDAPDEPVSMVGDCWQLGPHRIYCGDATDPASWKELMQGERADLCITDPPYAVDLGRKNRLMDGAIGGKRNAKGDIANDKMTPDEFRELLAGSYAGMFAALKPGGTAYVAHSDKAGDVFRDELQKAGFKFSQGVVWKKNQVVLGMAPYQPIHEPIMVAYKQGSKRKWYGGRKQKTVIETGEGGPISQDADGRWLIKIGDSVLVVDGEATLEQHETSVINVPKPSKSGLHPSTKPVELWEKLMRNSARPGDVVIDPFSGSGTTIVASDRLGMIARVMDLDPRYVDTAVIRWQHLTGRRAVNVRTGENFPVGPVNTGEAQEKSPEIDLDFDDSLDLF